MQAPLFVRPVTDTERDALIAGLHAPAALTLRRCHTAQRASVLASARQEHVPAIARPLGCNTQTVRTAIHAFNQSGRDALLEGSSRPHRIAAFDAAAAARLRALLHQWPRTFDRPTSVWTLDLAAVVCLREGIIAERVTGETIRVTLKRMGVRWQRDERMLLRFVDGRPVSGITTQFLDGCCARLAAKGKTALLLVWDNASWHVRTAVRGWITAHNRAVKGGEAAVRIIALPAADEEAVAQPDRAEMDAREAVDCRTGAAADGGRDRRTGLRVFRLPS